MSEKVTKEQFFDKLNAEQQVAQMPYYVHEGEMYRMERLNKRWFVAFLIVLVMLFVTNGAWIYHEMQYKDEVWTYEIAQDSGDGGTNTYADNTVRFIGGDDYGEATDQGSGQKTDTEKQRQGRN